MFVVWTCGAMQASTRAWPVEGSTRTPLRNPACLPTHPAALPRTANWASGIRLCHGGSDAVLEGLDRVGLHNLACGLRLHHDDLAEDLALAGLRRRLCPCLDPAKAGKHEDTRLGNFSRRKVG